MNLGIDLGRVIVGPKVKQDESFVAEPVLDAFRVIKNLVPKFNNTYIVSRVNSEQKERAAEWLINNDFYNQTGIPPENVYFCFDRRDKAIFQKGLKIDVFIDDRPNCLIPMEKHVIKFLFNPWEGDLEKYKEELIKLDDLVIAKNWVEIEHYFKDMPVRKEIEFNYYT